MLYTIFILILFLTEGQRGEAWEPLNKAVLFLTLGSTAQNINFIPPPHTSKAETHTRNTSMPSHVLHFQNLFVFQQHSLSVTAVTGG